jgi:hypothetical protein
VNVGRSWHRAGSSTPRRLPTSPFRAPAPDPAPHEIYAVGDRVNHDRYGVGTVTEVEDARSVVVDFGPEMRRIQLPNPKLCRI